MPFDKFFMSTLLVPTFVDETNLPSIVNFYSINSDFELMRTYSVAGFEKKTVLPPKKLLLAHNYDLRHRKSIWLQLKRRF
jgi:hypothetical protein